MSEQTTKALYVEYFRMQELLWQVQNRLPLVFMHVRGRKPTDAEVRPLVEAIRGLARDLNLDQKLFEKFLGVTIEGLSKGTVAKALSNYVRSHCDTIRRKICSMPNSLDKARDALRALVEVEGLKSDQVYDAFVLLAKELPSELISREIQNWKEDAKQHEEKMQLHFIPTNIFWVSEDFHGDIDGISRYRFREHFNFGEFESAFSEVESEFEANIATAAAGMAGIMRDIHGSGELPGLAYVLWLASRSPKLSNRIRDSVSLALNNIVNLQSPEGWWADVSIMVESASSDLPKKREYLPSIYITALCSLDLLKLSIQDSYKQAGLLGARWLLSKQNADGSWSRMKVTKDGINYEPAIFTTVLALESIIRSGIKNVEHSVDSGIKWIVKQQDDFGTWDDEGFPFPFMTVVILELLELRDTHPAMLNLYQSMSRGFLQRSAQLSLEDSADSRRLAIIAAHHGIEAFLYSVLTHPSINILIFKKDNTTIGMKRALDEFEGYLKRQGSIKHNAVLSHRNSLDRLKYLRDQIVHKAIGIAESDCHPLIEDALRFTREYSLQVFSFDVLS
jgi:hypothetical protein